MKPRLLFAVLPTLLLVQSISAQTIPKLWEFTAGNWIGTSPAIGYDGAIFFGCRDSNLYALNPNGTLRWSFPTMSGVISAPAIGVDGTIYFGSTDNSFYALTPAGSKKWSFLVSDTIYGSPAISQDGTIYFGTSEGKLYALYPDGTKRWDFAFGNSFGNSSSPAVASDGTIYIGTYTSFFAISPDGKKLWNFPIENSDCAPAIDTNGVVYVTGLNGNNTYLYALYPGGSLKWSFPIGFGATQSSPAIDGAGRIYVARNSTLFSINPDGSQNWTCPVAASEACAPAICQDGSILVGGSRIFSAVAQQGTIKWQFSTSGSINRVGAAVASDGTIYFGDYAGKFYALDGGQPLASTPWPMFHKSPTHPGRYNLQPEGPPTFGLQPLSQTAVLNSSIYFRTVAGGTPPLYFQWYKDGNPIPAATNSIFRIQSVQLLDAGIYTLTVSNSLNVAASDPATLTVAPGLDVALYAGIAIHGQAGVACQIDYSVDLSSTNNWTPLTNFTLPTATFLWVDPTPPTLERRYYRAFISP